MSIPNIPQDALVEILIRLPVKSLLRFRCVSKAWYSLISSPAFISTHTLVTNSPTKKSNLLMFGRLRPGKELDKFSLRFDDESFDEYRDVGRPLDGSIVRIFGSCHGLMCLSSEHVRYIPEDDESTCREETTVIWNPTLGISQVVPEFTSPVAGWKFGFVQHRSNLGIVTNRCEKIKRTPYSSDHSHHVFGFGYDGKGNDYKIVKIPCNFRGSGSPLDPPRQYGVFELSQNAWRTVTPRLSPPYISEFATSVLLNGSLHWVGGQIERTIVAFDLADEEFREMKLPGALNLKLPATRLHIDVVKHRGYLSVMTCSVSSENHQGGPYTIAFDIWVMKEYGVDGSSWSRLFTIHRDATGICYFPFGFRTNGELLVREEGDRLVSYDCSTEEKTDLGFDIDNPMIFVGEYVETLVMLKARSF